MGKAMSGKCQETRVLVVKYVVVMEECGAREGDESTVAWLGGGSIHVCGTSYPPGPATLGAYSVASAAIRGPSPSLRVVEPACLLPSS